MLNIKTVLAGLFAVAIVSVGSTSFAALSGDSQFGTTTSHAEVPRECKWLPPGSCGS